MAKLRKARSQKRSAKLIDFSELRDGPAAGEALQALAEALLSALGSEVQRVGRGPDGGKDLLAIESVATAFIRQRRRWLVQCKDFAQSGAAVNEANVGPIVELCRKHETDGYLLITTTTITKELSELFEKLSASRSGPLARAWDQHELTKQLMRPDNREVLKQYLPESYKRVASLGDDNVFLQKLRAEGVSQEDLDLLGAQIAAARSTAEKLKALDSFAVYPEPTDHRDAMASASASFVAGDLDATTRHLESLPYEEWTALVAKYATVDEDRTSELLQEMARTSGTEDMRLAAARMLIRGFDLEMQDWISCLRGLGADSARAIADDARLDELIDRHLTNAVFNDCPQDLDDLPPHTVEGVSIDDISYSVDDENAIVADVSFSVDVDIRLGDEDGGIGDSYPGTARLAIHNSADIEQQSLKVDVSSFFGGDEDDESEAPEDVPGS